MRDFDVERQERAALGRTREFKFLDQRFEVHLDISPRYIEDFLTGGPFSMARASALFKAFLTAESWERFAEVLEREHEPVTYLDIGEIAGWLIAEETGRPTRASSGSSTGRATNGTSSTDDSPPPGTETEPKTSLSVAS